MCFSNQNTLAVTSSRIHTFPHTPNSHLASVASPVIAGAVALLLSAVPSATVASVKQALLESARPLDGVSVFVQGTYNAVYEWIGNFHIYYYWKR